jgi:UDP-GlcNAc:undecaprenyl-phosphate GlcNAc-1-phosphate transferase
MINYLSFIFGFLISLSISLFLTPLMKKIALKKGILSKPGKRKIHTKPIPYLGGISIYFSFFITLLIIFYLNRKFRIEFSKEFIGLFIAGTGIVLLGLWDDIKNISPFTKLTGQIIIVLFLFTYGFRIELLTHPFFGKEIHLPLILSVFLTLIWFIGLINAMNLIDGLDGLAAGITVIACFTLGFIALYLKNHITAVLLFTLAGSCLGFLRFNFYPAQIFMGDAGSMFLGLILASTSLVGSQYKSATAVALLTPLVALTIPIYDTFMAIIRRLIKRRSIFKADRKHLHHRLLEMGLNQKQIVLFIYLVTLYFGIFAFLFVLIPNQYALILLILLALGLFMGMIVIRFVERKLRYIRKLELRKLKSKPK